MFIGLRQEVYRIRSISLQGHLKISGNFLKIGVRRLLAAFIIKISMLIQQINKGIKNTINELLNK